MDALNFEQTERFFYMENKKNATNIITGTVVLNFPHLFKRNSNKNFNTENSKYGTTVIIPKEDNETLEKIQTAISYAIAQGGFSDLETIKTPLNDGDVIHSGETLYKNSMYLYASTAFKPKVVDHNVHEIEFRMDEFPSGTYAKVSIQFNPYNFNGKMGVSAELVNVQILPGNKLLEERAKPEDEFTVVDE